MSHRKKKGITPQIQKQLAAQYRAEFFRKMKHIIDNTCGAEIFPLIPNHVLAEVYLCRTTPFKIKAAYNNDVPSKYLKDTLAILPQLIKNQNITLQPSDLEIPLYDFFTVVFTIVMLKLRITETSFNQADKVIAALQNFLDANADDKANLLLFGIFLSYNVGESNLKKVLYWCDHKNILPKTYPGVSENIIYVYSVTTETIHVTLEEGKRPAIRVGWAIPFAGARWISIKPSVLGIKSPLAEIPLKVYIQEHALNRLTERIDGFYWGIAQYNMFLSLSDPRIAYDNKNKLLIEYRIFGIKAGYFRADIVDGIILLRTFLFVTNNGTPEGQLLEKNTGLQKHDKQYLNIDKLSTFMHSDLDKNTDAQRLFIESNCECLIDLYNNMKNLLIKKDCTFNFNTILSYINVDKPDTMPSEPETALQAENNE